MRGYEAIVVVAGDTANVAVEPGDRLTLYTSATVSYGWKTHSGDAEVLFKATTGPDLTWPVDVPARCRVLSIRAGIGNATVRIAVNPPPFV